MAEVLHIFFSLTVGGAARTAIATAKYSASLGPYSPSLAVLSLENTDPRAIEFAISQGFKVPTVRNPEEMKAAIANADIVQINWWQHPAMDEFLRSNLPPCRLLGWFHCAGEFAPQRVTEELVDLMDLSLAGSFYTYEQDAFQTLTPEEKLLRTGMVNGGADLKRLQSFARKPHERFTVSYVGTVDFTKMHRDYIAMSSGVKIPGVRFLVCGGPHIPLLRKQASALGAEDRFELRGYVDDISSILAETDVFGYPLCEDTYAASELALQEAMYCGIPAVVFPHGGLKRLVYDGFNGLVVKSALEYQRAIEFLFENPAERERLGQNARRFAEQRFGAENWAGRMNEMYAKLLAQPKKTRAWGQGRKSVSFPAELPHPRYPGAERFIECCGGTCPGFSTSYTSQNLAEILKAEKAIQNSTELMRRAGVLPYQSYYKNDPFLTLWAGLVEYGSGNFDLAGNHFGAMLNSPIGDHSWRALWYLCDCARRCGEHAVADRGLESLRAITPNYEALISEAGR